MPCRAANEQLLLLHELCKGRNNAAYCSNHSRPGLAIDPEYKRRAYEYVGQDANGNNRDLDCKRMGLCFDLESLRFDSSTFCLSPFVFNDGALAFFCHCQDAISSTRQDTLVPSEFRREWEWPTMF